MLPSEEGEIKEAPPFPHRGSASPSPAHDTTRCKLDAKK